MSNSDVSKNLPLGVVASHPAASPGTVAQTRSVLSSSDRNTLDAAPHIVACMRIEDGCFEFDSVILRPEITELVKKLLVKREKLIVQYARNGNKPHPPITIFGHADPVGSRSYNKQLSEDRAAVFYGLLINDDQLWESIISRRGEVRQLKERMQKDKIYRGQIDNVFDAGTRAAMLVFMTILRDGPVLSPEKDFLKHGAYAYQGCANFNPVLIFSRSEAAKLSRDQDDRNSQNSPNRRVMVFLFEPGAPPPRRWPCPKAPDWKTCTVQFRDDGEFRLKSGVTRREHKNTQDTFACHFYESFAKNSPCEGVPIRVQLIVDHTTLGATSDVKVSRVTKTVQWQRIDEHGKPVQRQETREFMQWVDSRGITTTRPYDFFPYGSQLRNKEFKPGDEVYNADGTHRVESRIDIVQRDGHTHFELRAYVVSSHEPDRPLFSAKVDAPYLSNPGGLYVRRKGTDVWRWAGEEILEMPDSERRLREAVIVKDAASQAGWSSAETEKLRIPNREAIEDKLDELYRELRGIHATITRRIEDMLRRERDAALAAAEKSL